MGLPEQQPGQVNQKGREGKTFEVFLDWGQKHCIYKAKSHYETDHEADGFAAF
jgi:hypothetical protein